jgi:hypothetical protein
MTLPAADRGALLAHKARRLARELAASFADPRRPTYALDWREARPLARRFAAADLGLLRALKSPIREAAAHYLAHRFDLLGSGWVEVKGRAPEVSRGNQEESRRLRALLPAGYQPIDWQADFKSGFRWSESLPSGRISFGAVRGVDVKVPWELGRLQHLPQLAHAYRLAKEGEPGFDAPGRYVAEFRAQVLDFISANPPRFGVGWASSMDVALRAASLLASRDLFAAAGASFDAEFESVFARSIHEHGAHVAAHLDWHPRYRGNHYLCGVAGWLFVASYLPGADEWRAQAARALVEETGRQFLADGGNFEASTGYHRLSGEAVAWASALAADALPREHFERVAQIGRFAAETARPDGLAPQIGDQDGGRFLKLGIRWTVDASLEEELRDHRGLVAAIAGLAGEAPDPSWPDEWKLEHRLAQSLSGGRAGAVRSRAPVREWGTAIDSALRKKLSGLPSRRYELPFGKGTCEAAAFPDFGLFVLRRGQSYACIRCGSIGVNGLGAHAHNDALSIEVVAEGRDLVRDPGSYIYTPFPDERDRYRSVRAHFAPRLAGREPATLGPGLFRLGDEAQARCLYFGADGFLGMHRGYGAPVYRLVTVADTMLLIDDFSESGELEPLPAPGTDPVPYSPRYGVRGK